jgi:hypothetical protein
MNRLDTPQKRWGCGSIALVAVLICGALFLLPRLFGGGDNADPNNDTNVDSGDDAGAQSASDDVRLGTLEISEEVDRDGCPVDSVSSLRNSERFYVVAPNSEVPEGTDIFVRLYQDGVVVEDLPIITADQDYNSTCINFVFETVDGDDFDPGQYEAEFWVNGNSYDSIQFEID